jgi:hypothetical protein
LLTKEGSTCQELAFWSTVVEVGSRLRLIGLIRKLASSQLTCIVCRQ